MPENTHGTGFRGPSPEVGKATQWKPGQSGNPAGRPKGVLGTALLRRLLRNGEKDLEAVVTGIISAAKKGNPKAFAIIRDTIDGRPAQEVDLQVALRNMSEAEIKSRIERLLAKAKQ